MSLDRVGYHIPLLYGFNLGEDIKNLRSLKVKKTICIASSWQLDTGGPFHLKPTKTQIKKNKPPTTKNTHWCCISRFEEMEDTPQKGTPMRQNQRWEL